MSMVRMKPRAASTKVRAFAFDPRLAIGLGLVIASAAGVLAIVSAADETVAVYAAAAPLTPGDRIAADDLDTRHVRLDDAETLYLVPGDIPGAGLVVTRAVAEGELVPASAIGSADSSRMTSVVLEVGWAFAASVQPTSLVDIWAARAVQGGGFEPPTVLVSAANVVRLIESDSLSAGAEATAIEVLVPKAKLARVLEALAGGDAISIVPSNLPGR